MQEPLLYYDVHGTRGPYVLMVHGWLSSRAQWIPNLDTLMEFSRPVVIELFGHGRSPSPEESECYTPENYIREFERIRHQLGVEKWVVCGQSLGAALTLRYALNCPEHISAQILTNSRSALSKESWDETMKLLALSLEEKGREVIDTFPLHPSRNRHMDPEIKKALVEDTKLVDVQGFSRTGLYTLTNCSVRGSLHKNQVPALLIAGRFDKQFMPFLEVIEQIMPLLEIMVLEGGHAINVDASRQFNKAVQDFISRFVDV